jgi:hypothetical protein
MNSRLKLACVVVMASSACFPVIPEGGPCAANDECPTGQTCVAGVCRSADGGATAGGTAAGGTAGSSAGGAGGGTAGGAGGSAGGVGGGEAGGMAGGDAGGMAGGDAGGSAGGMGGGGDDGGMAGGTAGGMAGGMAGGLGGGSAGGPDDGGVPDGGFAQLTVDRTMATFGNVTTGASSPATTVLVTNVGDQPSGPVMVAVSGTAASSFQVQGSTCTGALGPMGTCQFGVVFSPTTTGALAATIDVSGMPGGSRSVAVSGQGAFPAALSMNPTTFDFRGVGLGSSSTPQVFTITNTGGSPTGVPGVAVTGPDGAMFTISGTTCTAVLAPAATCTVTLVFVPTTTGARMATLEVNASPGGRASSALTANGQTPAALSAMPSPGVFNDTVSGGMGNSISFTITNSGQTTTPALSVAISGAEAADFVRGVDSCQGAMVAGGGTCSVAVQFNPRGPGPRNALLTVSGTGVVPATVVLTGRGLAPAQLRLSTPMVSFGSVATGTSVTATIGVSNSGEAPTSFPMFTATPSPEFTVASNTCGSDVTPGENCSVTLRFSPAALGARTGTFTASATTGGMVGASVDGTGVAPGALAITPNTHTFGSFLVGQTSGSQTFTVTNTGGVAITSPALSLGGSAANSFLISLVAASNCGPPAVLAAGGSCAAIVSFTPQSAGALSAFLTATSGSNTAQASLSGTGLNPALLRITPSGATFPSTVVGSSFEQGFTVTNSGDVPSGTVSITRSGPDQAQWSVNSSTCTGTLAPQGTCTFRLAYVPTAAGGHSANVTASASPGSMATAPVTGTAISAAALTLAAAMGSSAAYGNVLLNDTRTMSFTVTNTGQQASGPLSLSLSGTNAAQWLVGSGATACQLGQPLAGGASCTTPIRFSATAASGNGLKSATLTASAMPGSSPTLALSATVQNPATISTMVTTRAFNDVTVGSSSTTFTWVVTNIGDVPTSTLSFSNSNAMPFPITSNTCTGTLVPMASCSVVFSFAPSVAGAAASTLTVSATTGGSVSLAASGNGQWLVTVTPPVGSGTRVQTADGRINCPGTCSAGYNDGTSVTFQARTNNGSGSYFQEWTVPSPCNGAGVGANCVRTISSNTPVNAVFGTIDANLVFVSSSYFPANLGGVMPYDNACNSLATAAGINNLAGNAFRAWMSTMAAPAASGTGARITATGGLRRMDGALLASSMNSLRFGQNRVPIDLDEWSRRPTVGLSVWTGTDQAGGFRPNQDCGGWTNGTGISVDNGRVKGGPLLFTANQTNTHTCNNTTTRIYCFMNTINVSASGPSVPTGGKIAFVSPAWTVSGGRNAADAHCNANKPSGFDTSAFTYVAFLATSTESAASRLPVRTSYYAPNGQFIGTSDNLKNTTTFSRIPNFETGIWNQNGPTYVSGQTAAWTGAGCANCVGTTGTTGSTCNNWTSNTLTAGALIGRVAISDSDFFDGFGPSSCASTSNRLYCFQQ